MAHTPEEKDQKIIDIARRMHEAYSEALKMYGVVEHDYPFVPFEMLPEKNAKAILAACRELYDYLEIGK